ncbi:MAG: redoxin domain-containing protein [Bacteroidota bacterium]|nr:redoxin domain-containing protein [Bacteroidota bacterium]
MKKAALFAIMIFFFLAGCKDEPSKNTALIEGHLNLIDRNYLILEEMDIKRIHKLDTLQIKNGRFNLEFPLKEASIFLLRDGEVHYLPMIIKPGDKIEIKGSSFADVESFNLSGSPQSLVLKKYEARFRQNQAYADSLIRILRSIGDQAVMMQKRQETQPLYDSIVEDQEEFAKKLVKENPGTLAALFLLNQRFGQTNFFDIEQEPEYFYMVDSALMKNLPANKHSIDHHIRMASYENKKKADAEAAVRLAIGKKAPELSLPDTSGNVIPLQSFRGKNTLIFFWAAMDVLARKAVNDLHKFYQEHKDENFEVYAISLDKNESMWKGAIRLDQLNWVNVADLGGLKTPTARLFNIPDLNYFVLLDPQGRIQYKGKDLSKLKELLRKNKK